jgi:predicted amidophosphoribosyltransferase
MATVTELSAPYADFMLSPRPGPNVCDICFNLTAGYRRCWACMHGGRILDVVAPISYSVGGGQLHRALAAYKRSTDRETCRLFAELAAVLWRHLDAHEGCVARAAGVEAFDIVTTVPSSDRRHDDAHPLHRLVGRRVGRTRDRHVRLLRRTAAETHIHAFDRDRYTSTMELNGQAVLLIDDMWTTGANAQSAAAALKHAGSGPVAAIVIGRHLNPDWGQNVDRIRRFEQPFDWRRCARCVRSDGGG